MLGVLPWRAARWGDQASAEAWMWLNCWDKSQVMMEMPLLQELWGAGDGGVCLQ